MKSNLYVVTVATEQKLYMKYLISSVKKNFGELVILGLGQKWQGFNWRNLLVKEYLEKLNPDDIVCFIDGYDVLCLRNLSLLKETFVNISKREKKKIIVGYDNVINPVDKFIVSLYYGKCNNISLNAGTYIGYVKDILIMINNIFFNNNNHSADDQILLTNFCNQNSQMIYIDIHNEIFLTLSNRLNDISEYLTVRNNEVYYLNNKPFFLHCPSTFFDTLLNKLGYNVDYSIRNEIINGYYTKFPFIKYYDLIFIHYETLLIIILLLLLITFINIKKKK